MIIWSGFGFLGLLLPIVGFGLFTALLGSAAGKHNWPGGLGVVLGGAGALLIAQRREKQSRTLVDPATGQTVVLRPRDTLFWVPLRYVAIAMIVIGFLFIL